MLKEAVQEVRVFAPATVANVACGYDVLGFAIDAPGDEVVVRHCDKPGLHITSITGDDGKLPKAPEKNTAGVAALDLLRHLGMTDRGIEMEIHKKMPFGSGPFPVLLEANEVVLPKVLADRLKPSTVQIPSFELNRLPWYLKWYRP